MGYFFRRSRRRAGWRDLSGQLALDINCDKYEIWCGSGINLCIVDEGQQRDRPIIVCHPLIHVTLYRRVSLNYFMAWRRCDARTLSGAEPGASGKGSGATSPKDHWRLTPMSTPGPFCYFKFPNVRLSFWVRCLVSDYHIPPRIILTLCTLALERMAKADHRAIEYSKLDAKYLPVANIQLGKNSWTNLIWWIIGLNQLWLSVSSSSQSTRMSPDHILNNRSWLIFNSRLDL